MILRARSRQRLKCNGVVRDMPRTLRRVLPGVALHVIQRGNNRGACFAGDDDRLVYLANLRTLAGKHGCSVHAYCLMTNHVHLLLTPDDAEGPPARSAG